MFLSFNARALGLDLSPRSSLAVASAAGFDGLDVPLRDVRDAGIYPADLRSEMTDRNLLPGAFPLPVDWRGEESRFAHDLRRLPELADLALAIGLRTTGTWVLPALPMEGPRRTPERWLDWHVDRLSKIARVLDERGISLGLEVIGVESSRPPGSTPFLHRLADLGPLLGRLREASPNVGILLDAFHLYAAGEEAVEAVDRWAGRVCWVHLADVREGDPADRGSLIDQRRGWPRLEGPAGCDRLLHLLEARGYGGPVTVEPFREPGDPGPVDAIARAREAAEAARRVWPAPG